MRLFTCFAVLLLVTWLATPAHALWSLEHRQAEITESDDGMKMFTVVHPRSDNEDKISRTARLTLSDGTRVLMQMNVVPELSRSGWIYAFRLQPDLVKHTKLEVFESPAHDGIEERLPLGGTLYEYFAKTDEAAVETGVPAQREIACPVAPPAAAK